MNVAIVEHDDKWASWLSKNIVQFAGQHCTVNVYNDYKSFCRDCVDRSFINLLLLDFTKLDHHMYKSLPTQSPGLSLLCTNALKDDHPPELSGFSLRPLYLNQEPALKKEEARRKTYQQRFLVKYREQYISIPVKEISMFYSEKRLTVVRTVSGKKYILPTSIEALEAKLLDPWKFFRINRSTIIAYDDIKEMAVISSLKIKVILCTPSDREVMVSRYKIQEFKKWLGA